MKREIRSIALAAVLSGVAACAASTAPSPETADFDKFGTFNGAKVEVASEGGFAALSLLDRVDHDSRAYVHVMRHLCGTTCAPPTDSSTGTAPANVVDSLFNVILAQKNTFKDDYGTTRNGADMMSYTVRISSDGATKTIRGDDGSIPDALRQLVSAVRNVTAGGR